MPICTQSCSFLPLSIYAVVFMDFRPDVTDKGQEVIQDFIPVLLEVGLQDGHLLLGLLLHFSAAAAVGSQSRSFLGLELLLSLQAVLFNFSLSFFFGLLQPPVLSCFQRKNLHQEVVKRQGEEEAETKMVNSNSKQGKTCIKGTVPRHMHRRGNSEITQEYRFLPSPGCTCD